MPNRIIKESVCTSDTVDAMSWFEECFFHRLWVHCDDYGRMDGRIAILRAKLFPLKAEITAAEVQNALARLEQLGCIQRYTCEDKPYLYVTAWDRHQTIRAKRGRYPAPDGACMQMHADACTCASESNPNQSVSLSESISESESKLSGSGKPEDVPKEIAHVVSYLNRQLGTSYQPHTHAVARPIRARLAEGFSAADLCAVIDCKCADWNHTPAAGQKDMRPFLRPETLFGAKFQSYLNQPRAGRASDTEGVLRGGMRRAPPVPPPADHPPQVQGKEKDK